MSNPEILAYKGQLADARQRRAGFDAEASGLIVLIRQYLSPFQPVTKIKMPEVTAQVKRLEHVLSEIKHLDETISSLEEALG